jgi:membrane-bound serine protease (ClpP class)
MIVVLASGGVFIVAVAVLSRYYGSIPFFSRLILEAPQVTDDSDQAEPAEKPLPPSLAVAVAVGDWGVAESPLRPAGKAIFGDEYLDVVTDGSFVDKGSQVQIIQISGNRIVVRQVDHSSTS